MTDSGEMHVHPGGYLGLASVGELINVALVVPVASARQIAGAADQYLERWIAGHPHLRKRFVDAVRVTPVRATGPFASRVTRAWVPGAAVVGDAADFYDPFTGEGIYAALRGAELLAPFVVSTLEDPRRETDAMYAYDAARRREFAGKWMVERLVAAAISRPWLINRLTASLSRRKELADTLVGVCGDFVPPRELLHARFLLPLLFGAARGGNPA
jgi:flavin-dependent dehydrogenase